MTFPLKFFHDKKVLRIRKNRAEQRKKNKIKKNNKKLNLNMWQKIPDSGINFQTESEVCLKRFFFLFAKFA